MFKYTVFYNKVRNKKGAERADKFGLESSLRKAKMWGAAEAHW